MASFSNFNELHKRPKSFHNAKQIAIQAGDKQTSKPGSCKGKKIHMYFVLHVTRILVTWFDWPIIYIFSSYLS